MSNTKTVMGQASNQYVTPTDITDVFSTYLYTGNGSTQTITNGIDLDGEGGLVWTKQRTDSNFHFLTDTETGASKALFSNTTNAQVTYSAGSVVDSFSSTGYEVGFAPQVNGLGEDLVSWTFRKAPKFFDVIKYSGDSNATRSIPHGLGSSVGMIIIKTLNANDNWLVYHRGLPNGLGTGRLKLNNANAVDGTTNFLSADSSSVTFANNAGGNYSGNEYVMYLFAHDTASDGLIQCGSFVNDASSVNVEVNLGWKPQWLLIKGASSGSGLGHWYIYDSPRTGQVLSANQQAAESADTSFTLTNNGFTPTANYNGTLIYIAIRSASAPAITWPSSIEWTAGSTPSTPAEGETDVYTFTTDDGGTTYTGVQSIDNAS